MPKVWSLDPKVSGLLKKRINRDVTTWFVDVDMSCATDAAESIETLTANVHYSIGVRMRID